MRRHSKNNDVLAPCASRSANACSASGRSPAYGSGPFGHFCAVSLPFPKMSTTVPGAALMIASSMPVARSANDTYGTDCVKCATISAFMSKTFSFAGSSGTKYTRAASLQTIRPKSARRLCALLPAEPKTNQIGAFGYSTCTVSMTLRKLMSLCA